MAELTCQAFQLSSAELALDILDARERSRLLDHALRCPACRRELLALDETADRLLDLSPPVEPPPGFETSVLERLQDLRQQAGSLRQQAGRQGGRQRWPRIGAAVAAVLVAMMLVAGGFGLSGGFSGGGLSGGGSGRRPVAGTVTTAVLRSGHQAVGEAIASTRGTPWMSVAVRLPSRDRSVTCKLRLRNGSTVTVGSFQLAGGYGYWAAPLPATSSPVAGAELTGPGGRLVASGSLSVGRGSGRWG